MSTKKHDAGIHKYDKNGLCTNPSSLILHESDDYSYHLKFAETNVGWIGGYTLDCRQKVPKELLVNAKNTTYSSKQIACQTVAEIAWDFFRDELREGKSKKIKAAFKPLHDMLIELGSPLADEIKKTAPAKVKPLPGTEKPKDQAKTPARVPVRIDAKTIIYVNTDQDLSKAKENYLASKSTLKGHQRPLFIGTK